MQLTFDLNKQSIKRTDGNYIVAQSKNYISAKFNLVSDDWQAPLSVIFSGSKDYVVLLDASMECTVPWEVISESGTVWVSAFCGKPDDETYLHTANRAYFTVNPSGYKSGEVPKDPTPDVYNHILNTAKNAEDIAQSVRDDADAGIFKGAKGDTGPQGIQGP